MRTEQTLNEFMRRILMLPRQASTMASEVDYLHYAVITCTMLGAVALTVTGFIFVIKYRARGPVLDRERVTAPPQWLEALVVAGLLGLFCLFWVFGFFQYVKLSTPPKDSLDVYVTGKQWMWKFGYPDGHSSISTLYVPTSRPVRLLLTSRDVIHSFFVPAFRIKQDALPGRYTTTWFEVKEPGHYWIFCTEYCGTEHSLMRGEVIALAPEDYARWEGGARFERDLTQAQRLVRNPPALEAGSLALAPPTRTPPLDVETPPATQGLDLVELGERIAAQQGCLRCHTLDGTAYIGPTWAGLYGAVVPLEGGGQTLADPAYLTESMMDPGAKLHEGYPGVMPSYQGLLSPSETGALVELIKSLKNVASRPEAASLAGPQDGTTEPETQQGLPLPGTYESPPPTGPIEFSPESQDPAEAP